MTKRIALAALLATGLAAGAAHAQAPDAAGGVPGGGSIVRGGLSGMLIGSGDNAQVVYARPGAGGGGGMHLVQAGRTARFAGSDGGSPKFEYAAPAAADTGREAWVTGGGDDAQVTYGRPR